MLEDTPIAYGEHRADAERYDEAEWRSRGRRGQTPGSTSLVAIDAQGEWVGMMNGYVPDAATGPLLVGVYVSPMHRGRDAGVADALLDAVERWAASTGRPCGCTCTRTTPVPSPSTSAAASGGPATPNRTSSTRGGPRSRWSSSSTARRRPDPPA
nr:GNAT family N-acetyltransferase [Curtobacterium sp. WW7]